MLNLSFLEAKVPLTKSFRLDGTKDSYPMAFKFKSHDTQIETITDFHTALTHHAPKGRCLLKGELSHPLVWESRAGATDSELPTEWFVLDLDGVTCYPTIDDCLIDLGLNIYSHVVQWSASSGLAPGLRAHIFFLLDKPALPASLKTWYKTLNLETPKLEQLLTLTQSKASIRWPLDITVGQNDKLIYVSPPNLETGLHDPHAKHGRYELKIRDVDFVTLPETDELTARKGEMKKLNELRLKEGLATTRSYTMAKQGGVEYLKNPRVTAEVTGVKTERNFTYLNLNGGDSWGYYHPADNPHFLFNFKGEPAYLTKEIIPEYWAEVAELINSRPDSTGRIFLAFREFRTGLYWNGVYTEALNTLDLAVARNTVQLEHFMQQYGAVWGGAPKDWAIEYVPSSSAKLNFDDRIVNTYEAPKHSYDPRIKYLLPPVTRKVINHLCGDPEIATVFLNWLALIVQTKKRPCTAWLFHGTQGTGKGLLANRILPGLLGVSNVTSRRQSELEERFNSYLEGKLICVVDEVQLGSLTNAKRINSDIKNYITEPTLVIRKMRTDGYSIENTCSLIFCSNMPDPVHLDESDRRFHTGAYQPNKLDMTAEEIIALEEESATFHGFLMQHEVDVNKARYPEWTEAKTQVSELSMTGPEAIVRELKKGNFGFFIDQLPSGHMQQSISRDVALSNYVSTLRAIADRGHHATREELLSIFMWTQGNTGVPDSPNKFSTYLRHLRLEVKKIRAAPDVVSMGITIDWNIEEYHRNTLSKATAKYA